MRASVVGLLTSLTGFSGAAVAVGIGVLAALQVYALVVALWLAGFAAAAYWYAFGVESASRPVEELV